MRLPSPFSQPPIWREGRLGFEVASLLRDPVFRGEGVRDAGGQPVFLIPGFLAGDDSLGVMTRWLRRTGHHTHKAGMRSNVSCSEEAVNRLEERVELLAERRHRGLARVSRPGRRARGDSGEPLWDGCERAGVSDCWRSAGAVPAARGGIEARSGLAARRLGHRPQAYITSAAAPLMSPLRSFVRASFAWRSSKGSTSILTGTFGASSMNSMPS